MPAGEGSPYCAVVDAPIDGVKPDVLSNKQTAFLPIEMRLEREGTRRKKAEVWDSQPLSPGKFCG